MLTQRTHHDQPPAYPGVVSFLLTRRQDLQRLQAMSQTARFGAVVAARFTARFLSAVVMTVSLARREETWKLLHRL